jgi:hypothetical protein
MIGSAKIVGDICIYHRMVTLKWQGTLRYMYEYQN